MPCQKLDVANRTAPADSRKRSTPRGLDELHDLVNCGLEEGRLAGIRHRRGQVHERLTAEVEMRVDGQFRCVDDSEPSSNVVEFAPGRQRCRCQYRGLDTIEESL